MVRRPARRIAALPLVAALALTACGGGPGPAQPTATEDGPRSEAAAVGSLDGVESAVIEILAEGSFVDPELGEVEGQGGIGSGFIIDPSGIAVTNNHVVTGAASLQVWVDGEGPRDARFLGVSECSDLALIDIDGEDFPFLDWYEGDVTTGLEVYAAGFPEIAEPPSEYTLTDGIISQAEAQGDTEWASVESVIQHTARINPGNSGGPLVDANGAVVGINFASVPERDENYAIRSDEALAIVDQLRDGEDVSSIGINGYAVSVGEGPDTGIWVSSVESGSPADVTGIRGGDVLTELEGQPLAEGGTMAEYCDILRSHDPDAPLAVEVLRSETGELFEGEINGRELELVARGAQPTDDAGDEYVTLVDETGALSVSVPATWTDTNTSAPWVVDGEEVGYQISASTDLQAWYETYDVPGMFFGASETLAERYTPETLLGEFELRADCTYDGREEYSDAAYTGFQDFYVACGGTDTEFAVIAAESSDESRILLVQVQVVTDADLEAYDVIVATFVAGDLE